MTDTFHASKPIYFQLAERIQRQILRGELAPGDKLPSVREMGIQSSVNPNTVQRTYRELEGMNIVETKRGQGTFVTEDKTVLDVMRNSLKKEEISRFVTGMHQMGYTDREIESGLTDFLNSSREEPKQ
ncbi:GntR family transcriptional regulator [Alkalihalophilus marmarensis]|jgi:DNA-binding transcriptional regulator YhcF (GntR family)|uniref:GntR family transcriptional regulator n=1 Tax=Alkalihalophilus marmarensis DSM 21297 TaxID=1188261 RepID=U6SS69_9BACI|nr:GntR family transcriptional regulator [Alkalihalophilus marmarensis]ERN54549.1 GntR family transcriptional regulator [Alkalihalophilus marmarensis DSM 21297]MCM3490488.1 GntR family transcriptional regulator [Alkalihalophilus marmarensis]